MISFSLEDFIDHNELEIQTEKRYLDLYPEFTYNDSLSLSLVFPEGYDVTIINSENLQKNCLNNTGSYCISTQQNKNVLKVNSRYQIKTDRIPANDIKSIGELNESCDQGKHSSLLIRYSHDPVKTAMH